MVDWVDGWVERLGEWLRARRRGGWLVGYVWVEGKEREADRAERFLWGKGSMITRACSVWYTKYMTLSLACSVWCDLIKSSAYTSGT